jgi:hypothetical protein
LRALDGIGKISIAWSRREGEIMFTSEDIKGRVKAQPFVPLRILTTSGDQYDVYHPDMIMVGQRFVIVGTASEANPTIFERTSQVAIWHIAALEPLPVPGPSQKNGQ